MSENTFFGRRIYFEILEIIHEKRSATKNILRDELNLSLVTIHNAVTEMLEIGALKENGLTNNGLGRKPVQYSINEHFGFFIGVSLFTEGYTISAYDFYLNTLYSQTVLRSTEFSPDLVEEIIAHIHEVEGRFSEEYADILSIGISVPGIVNHRTGEIYTLFRIKKWAGVNLADLLKNDFNEIPINVDNDATGMLLCEKWRGNIPTKSASFLSITDGLGASALEESHIIYGGHSNFGEIGHIPIELDGRPCRCGSRGCLETFVADGFLVETIRRIYPEKNITTIDEVIEEALPRNNGVYNVLKEVTNYILVAMYIIFSAYDPELLILGSTWMSDFPELFLYLRDEMYRRFPWVTERDLAIELRDIKDMRPLSSGGIALENFFQIDPA